MAKKHKNSNKEQHETGSMEHSQSNTETRETMDQEGIVDNALTGDERERSLEALVDEQKDKYLRLYAEFENFKKRNVRERLDLLKSAAQETLSAILPVLDDFDRAKMVSDSPDTEESFSEGVSMVYNRLYQVLQNQGLSQMESTGAPFDPDLHEAITEIPAPSEDMKGKVIDTIEKGYYLNDKIIRHAKVVVGK